MPFIFRKRTGEDNATPGDADHQGHKRPRRGFWKQFRWRPKRKRSFGEREDDQICPPLTVAKAPNPSASTESKPAPTQKESVSAVDTAIHVEQEKRAAEEEKASQIERLSIEDIRSLFSGAPQFSIADVDGNPRPKAEFPWDYDLNVRDVSDCVPIDHPAYSSATLRPHLPSPGSYSGHDAGVLGYDIGVFETPSVLSWQGKESGTVGFEYFLQEPIADALGPRPDHEESSENDFDSFSNYDTLQNSPERLGIRRFDRTVVAERLAELCDFYKEYRDSWTKINILANQTTAELYTGLFTKILSPPGFDSSTEDPTGLKVQIEALIRALKLQHVWYDFSDVEWRIRLGQILWKDGWDSESPDPSTTLTDRDLLLLQLVLSSELLIRLDAVSGISTEAVNSALLLTPAEVRSFRSVETRKTRWDLVLARRFLENIQLRTEVKPGPASPAREFPKAKDERGLERDCFQDQATVTFLPRRLGQQLSGLLHFSRRMDWPKVDRFEQTLVDKFQMGEEALTAPSPSIYATPLSTPRSTSNRSSGYFSARPTARKIPSQQSIHLQAPDPPERALNLDGVVLNPIPNISIGGWLSRSYLTGLVLPGEMLSHLLISTLLENDRWAMTSLGDSANLYGGFVYQFRSWWSKQCVVGKVLACLKGTAECMGWLSCPNTPQNFPDGWVAIEAEDPPATGTTPRIEQPKQVRIDADFLAAAPKDEGTKPTDLVLPRDSPTAAASPIWFDGLRLQARELPFRQSVSESDIEDASQTNYAATLYFSASSTEKGLGHPAISLRYNVQFVSAFPCAPPSLDKLRLLERDGDGTAAFEVPAHPLHVTQTFEIQPAIVVLSNPFTSATQTQDERYSEATSQQREGPPNSKEHKAPETNPTLILDARGDAVLELVARAWCASLGYHALVGRVGDTCIACCVREARALGIGVVIRVA